MSSNINPQTPTNTAPLGAGATPNPASQPKPKVPSTIEELAKQILDMRAQLDAKDKASTSKPQTQAETKPAEIDWANIKESDVFDLSIPIPAIEHQMPDYLDVHLKDPMYVARWVHKLPERLGPALQAGYNYITKEDLDDRFPIPLTFDTEGHYAHADVVALKILKSRYYPALRRNHEKTMAIHGRGLVKGKINKEIENSPVGRQMESALRRGAISFYEEETREEAGLDLESLTL